MDCTKPKADLFPDRHLFAKSKRLSDALTFSVPCATAMLHQYTRTLDVNLAWGASLLPLNQQRSDKGAFFRQEVFCSKIARVATRAVFVAGHSKYGSANCKCAGRFGACRLDVTEYRECLLFLSQA